MGIKESEFFGGRLVGYLHAGRGGAGRLRNYAAERNARIVERHLERDDRRLPALRAAIADAHLHDAIIVAPTFTLAANSLTALTLILQARAKVVALDIPALAEGVASVDVLKMMQQLARQRTEERSRVTKLGQARAVAAGKKIGNPDVRGATRAASKKRQAEALEFARRVAKEIEKIERAGFVTLREIARELENRRVLTAKGRVKWHGSAVRYVKLRAANAKKKGRA